MPTSSVTAQAIIDEAQSRHPAFSNALAPLGALLRALDSRQRSLILRWGGAIDGLVNTTVQLPMSFNGLLVQQSDDGTPMIGSVDVPGWVTHEDTTGVPYVDFTEPPISPPFGSNVTYPDGWPVHLSAGGTPYVNFSEPAIAGDPFGINGGTPGFPLPRDFVKLVLVSAVLDDQTILPVDVVPERDRLVQQRSAVLNSFISGSRLVPLRAMAKNNAADMWSLPIIAIQLSYVALPVLRNLSDLIALPAALHEALIAGLAERLASSAPGVSPVDKARFSGEARDAEAVLGDLSSDVIAATTPQYVRYRR